MNLFDDSKDVTEKILENQDLDQAAEDMKSRAEAKLDDDVNKYNLRDVLQKRRSHASQVEDSASTKLDLALETYEDIENLQESDRFQRNLDRNAVDADTVETLLEDLRHYRQAVSRLAILLKIYKDQDEILSDAIDIQQMRHDESKVMNLTKDYIKESQSQFQQMGNEIVEEVEQMNKDLLDEVTDSVEDLQDNQVNVSENLKATAQALESATENLQAREETGKVGGQAQRDINTSEGQSSTGGRTAQSGDPGGGLNGVAEGDRDDLTQQQEDLYDLVKEHPDRELQWYADELGKQDHIVKGQVTKIENKGFDGFSDRVVLPE